MVLSYDGQLAGIYDTDALCLYEGFEPEILKKDDQSYFGTFQLDGGFVDNGLKAGKDYRIELISTKDIQLVDRDGSALFINADGSGKQIGTLYHELSITAPTDAISLGLHLADDGEIEFGAVAPVEGSTRSYVTFRVDHFSPFIICTFAEVNGPELKSITSGISHTDSRVWIWLAGGVVFAAGASVAAVFLIRKRKK